MTIRELSAVGGAGAVGATDAVEEIAGTAAADGAGVVAGASGVGATMVARSMEGAIATVRDAWDAGAIRDVGEAADRVLELHVRTLHSGLVEGALASVVADTQAALGDHPEFLRFVEDELRRPRNG